MKHTVKMFALVLAIAMMITCLPIAAHASDTINVSIMVIGSARHSGGSNSHKHYQMWLPKTNYTLPAGSTAEFLIKTALSANGMSAKINSSPFGNYVERVTAPAKWGGHVLSDAAGLRGNGPYSGWNYTSEKLPGSGHTMPFASIDALVLTNGEFLVLRYVDDYRDIYDSDFAFAEPSWWLQAAASPPNTGGGSSGGGLFSGLGSLVPSLQKKYTAADISQVENSSVYRLTVERNSTIKADAFGGIPQGCVFHADMVSDNRVQFRVSFATPSEIKTDIKAGMGAAPETNAVKKLFRGNFNNKLEVLIFDHEGAWGQEVEVMLHSANVSGFDSDTWKLYRYNTAENTYAEISWRLDANGYIRYFTDTASPVVLSEGSLQKK